MDYQPPDDIIFEENERKSAHSESHWRHIRRRNTEKKYELGSKFFPDKKYDLIHYI